VCVACAWHASFAGVEHHLPFSCEHALARSRTRAHTRLQVPHASTMSIAAQAPCSTSSAQWVARTRTHNHARESYGHTIRMHTLCQPVFTDLVASWCSPGSATELDRCSQLLQWRTSMNPRLPMSLPRAAPQAAAPPCSLPPLLMQLKPQIFEGRI
jgi:hypothetical protein